MGERVRVRKDRDERREQILVCARELFSERPYEEVSNTEIAAVAGVSRGLLNHYFGTKRELYLAVVERMLHIPPVPVPAYEPGASVRERVTESITGWLELLERNAGTWLVALDMAAGTAGDDDLARLVDAAREGAVDHITEVVGLSRLAAEHPEVRSALRGFSGMAEAATREWLRHGRLTRAQVHLLLEETIMHLIEETVPRMTAQD
ncbi:TetR/AcrR family transcriptional regulator [Actinomadura nitritigenes]|uniref:TetR/AcrR family transcriptional regulator n=1 Tax=Actinomadura nitritigenes TaxID=134602 RepID=UPI003D8FB977